MTPCPHCINGQVLGGECLQCGRPLVPVKVDEWVLNRKAYELSITNSRRKPEAVTG